MKLLSQIIEKKLSLSQEFFLNRNYKRGVWNFYMAFNISLAVLGKEEDKKYARLRNKLWRGFLLHDFEEKRYKKLQVFIRNDILVIINAIKLIREESEKMGYEMSDLYVPFSVGCLAFEYGSE